MIFAREYAVDELLLNEVVWRSVRGPDCPMPAPARRSCSSIGERRMRIEGYLYLPL